MSVANNSVAGSREFLDALLRTDLYSFLRSVFPTVSPGRDLLLNWHIEAITNELAQVIKGKTRRLIITVPPRSLKSICASVVLPAYALGHDPTRRVICVSYSEGLAHKHANDCRALMRSTVYRRRFPATRISKMKDTESEIMNTARGFRLATSVGGTLTGRGGDLIIIDDPMKPQDALSATAREHVLQWYTNTLLSRLDSKVDGAIIVVMQRLHPEDLVGYLLDQDGWTHLNLPAIAEAEEPIALGGDRFYWRKPGSALHPEREPVDALEGIRRDMGSLDFSAQYQQAPIPVGGNLIKRSWFRFYDEAPTPRQTDQIIVSWDTAMSSTELADYSACVALLVRGETVYLLDVFRARVEYPDLKRKVLELHQRWRRLTQNYALVVENKGSGMSLVQDLARENIHAIGVVPEGDKVMRMNAQTAPIEAGAVFLPKQAIWLDEFLRELLAFPACRHSDQVDAFSQGLKRAFAPRPAMPMFGRY